MAFLIITSPATDRFIGALCNTLVHSLWQGLILAAVTGLIILLTRKSAPAMRYNLLISALALFVVGVGVTFAVQLEPANPLLPAVTTIVGNESSAAAGAIQINVATSNQSLTDSLFSYLKQHHDAIVSVWFLIICAKSIQLIVGLLGVRRLKRSQVHQVSKEWYNRMLQLAGSLGIKQSIALLESGLAKVPMVIGTFKPVILIPIGLLTALSTEEVEAILVHELAHIKRRDYLVNLLQSLMEIVFFFNPAVLWISQLIKAERENCCDDMALSQSGNKISYIKALISCEEYQASVPAYAMAFAGDKNTLISRVKRMVSNNNHSLNLFEKTALAVCLVASGLCISAFTQKEQIKRVTDLVAKAIVSSKSNNIKHITDSLTAQINNAEAEFGTQIGNTISKNVVSSHFGEHIGDVVAKEVAAAHIGDRIAEVIAKDRAAARPGENIDDKIAKDIAALHLSDQINNKVTKDIADSRLNERLADKIAKDIATSHLNERHADKMAKLYTALHNDTLQRLAAIKFNPKYNPKFKISLDSMKMRMSPLHINLDSMKFNPNVNVNIDSPKVKYHSAMNLNAKDRNVDYGIHNPIAYNAPNAKQYTRTLAHPVLDTSKNRIKIARKFDIADALYDAHLIKDKRNYKVILNNKEMVVNGAKQPQGIHQTFLKYYQKTPGDNVDLTIGVTNSN